MSNQATVRSMSCDFQEELAKAELEQARLENELGAMVKCIAIDRPQEERVLLEDLLNITYRHLFLVAFVRCKLELGMEKDLIDSLRDMFDQGEGDFSTHAPSLAEIYNAVMKVEEMYARNQLKHKKHLRGRGEDEEGLGI